MPEYAEVKITSEYINCVCENRVFSEIGISNITHNRIDTNLPFEKFSIITKTRGKELQFILKPQNSAHQKSLVAGFGMTGNWHFVDKEDFEKLNHVHLYFKGQEGNKTWYLAFQDVRRFARWQWGNFSEKRGPDPLQEPVSFTKNIQDDLSKKIFDGRIMEVLLNQKYFNGVGNYLRAEIIAQANINPFLSAREVLSGDNGTRFIKKIELVIMAAYTFGGAQLKDWKNPFHVKKEPFMNWLQVYGKGESILDKNKRNFWFDKKWKNENTTSLVKH